MKVREHTNLLSFFSIYSFYWQSIAVQTNKNWRYIMTELQDVIEHLQRFSWPDYFVFILMLFFCVLIGIYFGFMKKSLNEADYLMGGRNMMIFPISLSLIARYIILLYWCTLQFKMFFAHAKFKVNETKIEGVLVPI